MGMRHRRTMFRVALSMTALVALMGCSDDLVSTTSPAGERAPDVIRVAGGGGDAKVGNASPLGAPEAASSMVAGDARMMPMPCAGVTEFELVGELPALDTPADGWRYSKVTELDPAVVSRLTAAFGLTGSVEALPAEWGGGWRVGPDDGSAPALWLGADGLGWWSYSAPWPSVAVAEPAPVEAPDAVVSESSEMSGESPRPIEPVAPPEVKPPVGVPDAAQAEALARQRFAELGLEVNDADLEVYADEWSASVTLWHTLNGVRTGFATSVGFGENATITYAGGQFNTPEAVSGFARVGTPAAFERLSANGGMWWGGGVSKMMVDCAPVMTGEEAGVESGTTVEPPTFTVNIVGVKESWWTLYDVDGTVWLVPGYTFVDSEGGEHLVPAVSDELVQPAEPMPVDEPTPVEEPAPVEGPAVSEPAPGNTGASEPGYDPDQPVTSPVSSEVVERVVGLPEDEASTVAKELGFEMRVTERDGESFPVTADYRTDRINVVIEAGVVTTASIG